MEIKSKSVGIIAELPDYLDVVKPGEVFYALEIMKNVYHVHNDTGKTYQVKEQYVTIEELVEKGQLLLELEELK